MHAEVLASFILLIGGRGSSPGRSPGCPGCPGCPGWVLCGKCRSPFVRFKWVGGFGWLMFEKVFEAIMALEAIWLSGLSGLGVVWQVQESLCSL